MKNARTILADLVEQLDGIGIPDWHGAEGLDLSDARALLAQPEALLPSTPEGGMLIVATQGGNEWSELNDPDQISFYVLSEAGAEIVENDGFGAVPDGQIVRTFTLRDLLQPTLAPRVAVVMDGGVVHAVMADQPARVDVLDYDTDGAEEEDLCDMPQSDGSTADCYIGSWSPEIDHAIFVEIDAALNEKHGGQPEGPKP